MGSRMVLLWIAAWTGGLLAHEPAWVGYRGPEGTGVFPGNPPVDCDMKTGRNIRWRAPLPNWSHASPTIVGGRAFVMSEPGWEHDWAVLTCVDIATGKVLWEREINHLPATGLPPAKQEEIAKKWHDFQAEWRKLYTTFAETVGQKKPGEAIARFKEMGYGFKGHSGGGYGQLRSLGPKPRFHVREAGLRDDVWRHACGLGYDEIGSAFATPVTDGRYVYVVADRSAAACYDLDGKLRWLKCVPLPSDLRGYNESNGRSPILYRDLMISDYFGHTAAFDKATGAMRWMVRTFGAGIATPGVITVGGVDILLTEGQVGKRHGLRAIRLPEGKLLKLQGWGTAGNVIMVNSDHRDVAYFSSGCHGSFSGAPDAPDEPLWTSLPAAVRFALVGETLKATVLWDGSSFAGKAPSAIPMVCYRDRLYIGGTVLEALTGKVLAGGEKSKRVLPPTRHLLLLAGGRFYGLDGYSRLCDAPPPPDKPAATLHCYSLDGKQLGASPLYMAPVTDKKLAQTRSQVGWDRWGFGYGMPFTIAGDCLYLRSSDELICVGAK